MRFTYIKSAITLSRCMPMIIALLINSGCSIKMASYSPGILLDGEGRVYVKDFKYMPGDNGGWKRNQIDTGSALQSIYSDMNINDHVAEALSKELKYIGYKIDINSPVIISGTVIEYSCREPDILHTYVRTVIEFSVIKHNGAILEEVYKKIHKGEFSTGKYAEAEYSSALNEGLRMCIKSFIVDAKANNAL